MRMVAVLITGLVVGLLGPLGASRAEEDEIPDRFLLVMQERGGLAPGTRPTCFAAWKTQVTEAYYKPCPWDQPPSKRKVARPWPWMNGDGLFMGLSVRN
ncbi:hypothetical protein [Blastochloris sulfoviridis]|uniref:Uncharacterized protein n=1 Tax=Blastochloris sulfoviridis TaxID=50712 RepID=A0A5M6HVH7_9HYPH|nr:hypothetical protein [Blastochloris sulfoviridis]KAA5599896.1 hypothetical protein F1193_10945 [Blastochloris sulfoviridis]